MAKNKEQVKLTNLLLESLQGFSFAKAKEVKHEKQFIMERCLEVMKNIRMFEAAASKHWLKPIQKFKARLSRELLSLSEAIGPFSRFLNSVEMYSVKFSEIWAALNQIEQEFGEYKYDQADKTLSVLTDIINLDGLSLGSFEIRLSLDKLPFSASTSLPYCVIALEPNPAASDPDVTHPHVSHEKLCEGDGYKPIRRAIEQGRLCDFFTIVANTLQTYNPHSAYVSIGSWEGVYCHNCGYSTPGDSNYFCEECEYDYCPDCITSCHVCDTTICNECSLECKDCGETICKQCIDEDELCSNCQKLRKDSNNEKIPENSVQRTQAQIQSNSLVKADIHA